MESDRQAKTELTPLNPIRVETALSRYPVHRLAKKGNQDIEIREVSEDGGLVIKWEVSHNSKDGHPGPLAYKLHFPGDHVCYAARLSSLSAAA